jgi:hypothetical protein
MPDDLTAVLQAQLVHVALEITSIAVDCVNEDVPLGLQDSFRLLQPALAPIKPLFAGFKEGSVTELLVLVKTVRRISNDDVSKVSRKRGKEIDRIANVDGVVFHHFAKTTMYW